MKGKKLLIGLVIFFIALGTAFSFYYINVIKDKRSPSLAYYSSDHASSIRPFKFANQEGDTITHEMVKGKIVVADFFFTTCQSICPTMSKQMNRVYQTFKTNDNIVILSHTVDPKRDTVGAMKAYSLKFDADPKRWMFLTGSKEDLYNQAYHSYKVSTQEDPDAPIDEQFIHSPDFVLVDKRGRLRAHKGKKGNIEVYNGTDSLSVNQLIEDIKILLNEKDEATR